MGIITKYKFNQNTYENFIPEFNTDFTDYAYNDEIDTDGMTIRTIGNGSGSLPTLIKFGATTQTDREKSLLEVYECNTSQVTDMGSMFYNCSSLTSLDVSNFDTSQVTDMNNMFRDCSSLTSLDVSNFYTSQVPNMTYMFANCYSLTSLDVSNFDTSKVINMSNMFYNCSKLTSLNVSNFDTSQVTNMARMFQDCSSLTHLDISSFDGSVLITGDAMFYRCVLLQEIIFPKKFITNKCINISTMFRDCPSLKYVDVSDWDTSNVTTINQTFKACSSLTSLDLSSWDTTNVTSYYQTFNGCESLQYLDISNFNMLSSATDINTHIIACKNLVYIGMLYCNSETINIIVNQIGGTRTIWYSDAKLEDLIKKENITYKEYKMNILESDEEINLRRIGDVYDELNLETGEYIQRINEIMLDENISWGQEGINEYGIRTGWYIPSFDSKRGGKVICDKTFITGDNVEVEGIRMAVSGGIYIQIKDTGITIKEWLKSNPLILQYEVMTPVIKTINLKGKPSINWQGDTYLHLENNTLYPQLECEIESINYYEIPKLKANTLYTLRYVGEPTQCIFGGLTYRTKNNMILTSGSSDNLLYFDKEVRKVILIEGDVRDRNFDYFEGIESLGAVEIITHKSDMSIFSKVQLPPHIQLHSLPDGTCDELDIKTGILTRNVGYSLIVDYTNYLEYYNQIYTDVEYNDNYISNYILRSQKVDEKNYFALRGSENNLQNKNLLYKKIAKEPLYIYYELTTPITEKLILNYNNSCNYGVILPRGTSDNYNVITNEYKQNLDFIPIDGSIAFDTATIKDTTVKFSVAISKFEVDTTNVRGSDGIYCDNNLFKYEASDNDYEHAYIENDTTLHIYVNKSRLSSYDQVGFQLYLTNNPFNLYYAMRNSIMSYVNYEDLDPKKASWEMLDCTEDGSITIESGNMDKTLLLDCMDYVAPTKNRFEIDLLKANTQYTVYAEGVSGRIQLNFGGNIVNFTSGNIYTSGETQLVEFYTYNEIKNLIIIEGDTRNETIEFFEGLKSSENVTVISSSCPFVFGKGGKI